MATREEVVPLQLNYYLEGSEPDLWSLYFCYVW